jgi:hypothetical protein
LNYARNVSPAKGESVRLAAMRCARGAFWVAVAARCALRFIRPFTVSREPDQPAFKLVALAV